MLMKSFLVQIIFLRLGLEMFDQLLDAFRGPLLGITQKHLPEDLQEDFVWIEKNITKYKEKWPGQLEGLRVYERKDPSFKERMAYFPMR